MKQAQLLQVESWPCIARILSERQCQQKWLIGDGEISRMMGDA
jgi:hypothetical protein